MHRAALVLVVIAALCTLSASSALAKDPVTLRDDGGDAGNAPDLSQLRIEDNGRRGFVFTLVLSTMPDLQPDGIVFFWFDTDRNSSTGNRLGAELLVVAGESGVAQARWDGSDWAPISPPVDRRLTGSGVQFTTTDLGTDRFAIAVTSTRLTTEDVDALPNEGLFAFPATIDGIVIPGVVLKPRAGRVLDARGLRAKLSSAEIVRPQLRCTLKYGKIVKPLAGGCRWRIPRTLKGKQLTLTVTFTYGRASITRNVPLLRVR